MKKSNLVNVIIGTEFVKKFNGQIVWLYDIGTNEIIKGLITKKQSHSRVIDPGKELVWYRILRGDQEIWETDIYVNKPVIEKL